MAVENVESYGLKDGGAAWRVSGVLSKGLAICCVPDGSAQLLETVMRLLSSVMTLAKDDAYPGTLRKCGFRCTEVWMSKGRVA